MNYAFHLPASMIIGALALDAVFGDPTWLPHPVRLIGRAIAAGDRYLHTGNPRSDLISGALLALVVIAAAGLSTWAIIAAFQTLGSYVGALVAILIAWTTLALRGLEDAAHEVEYNLNTGDEGSARHAIRALVGRDPETLDRSGLIRGTIESVAENSSDGVVAPLFFLFAAGPAGAIAYKAINTLDSMIGHRDERYLYFGRAAARIDDAANLIPARLSAVCIAAAAAFTTRRSIQAIRACVADARKHLTSQCGVSRVSDGRRAWNRTRRTRYLRGRAGATCNPWRARTLTRSERYTYCAEDRPTRHHHCFRYDRASAVRTHRKMKATRKDLQAAPLSAIR